MRYFHPILSGVYAPWRSFCGVSGNISGPDLLCTGSVRLQNHCFFAPFLEFLDQEKSLTLIIFDRAKSNVNGKMKEKVHYFFKIQDTFVLIIWWWWIIFFSLSILLSQAIQSKPIKYNIYIIYHKIYKASTRRRKKTLLKYYLIQKKLHVTFT